MTPHLVLGIDPGHDGGAALLTLEVEPKLFCAPLGFKVPGWERMLFEWCVFYKPTVFAERVHSWKGQGVKSTWSFADSAASSRTVVTLARLEINYFEPEWWQLFLHLPMHREIADKAKRRKARRIDQEKFVRENYPELADWNEKKKGDIFAAVLIGRAGVKKILEDR